MKIFTHKVLYVSLHILNSISSISYSIQKSPAHPYRVGPPPILVKVGGHLSKSGGFFVCYRFLCILEPSFEQRYLIVCGNRKNRPFDQSAQCAVHCRPSF